MRLQLIKGSMKTMSVYERLGDDENVESNLQEDTQPPQEEGKKTHSGEADSQLSLHIKGKGIFSSDEM